MGKICKELKAAFELPQIAGEVNSKNRAASPMELFFDLAFVAAMGSISLLFDQENFTYLFFGLILFFYVILSWSNVTLYNIYFWSENGSHFIRVFLLIIMLPIVLMSSIDEITIKSMNFFLVDLIILKLLILTLWYLSLYKNEKIKSEHMKHVMKKYFLIRLVSIFILFIALFSNKEYLFFS